MSGAAEGRAHAAGSRWPCCREVPRWGGRRAARSCPPALAAPRAARAHVCWESSWCWLQLPGDWSKHPVFLPAHFMLEVTAVTSAPGDGLLELSLRCRSHCCHQIPSLGWEGCEDIGGVRQLQPLNIWQGWGELWHAEPLGSPELCSWCTDESCSRSSSCIKLQLSMAGWAVGPALVGVALTRRFSGR